jgi:hypothetical protein
MTNSLILHLKTISLTHVSSMLLSLRASPSLLVTPHVNLAQIQYPVSFHDSLTIKNLSLLYQGVNSGAAGDDVHVIFCTNRTADIKCIDNHRVNDIGSGAIGGVVNTQKVPFIAILHQYALLGKGSSIHSPSQFE